MVGDPGKSVYKFILLATLGKRVGECGKSITKYSLLVFLNNVTGVFSTCVIFFLMFRSAIQSSTVIVERVALIRAVCL